MRVHAVWPSIVCFALQLAAGVDAGLAASAPRHDVPYGLAYAESLLRYDPAYSDSCVPTDPKFTDPYRALGAPDYSGGTSETGAVSLGSGGLLEVLFVGAQISNSGDSRSDLFIVEVGSSDEAFYVALRPAPPTTAEDCLALGLQDANHDGFFEIGWISGGATTHINIDARFSHPAPELEVRFDAVQIVDDPADHPACTSKAGADIDAIEALQAYIAITPATWGSVKALYRD
jgi:hypothetical protein